MSWKSGTGVSWDWDGGVARVVCVEPGGVGETTSSRHWRVGLLVSFVRLEGAVGEGWVAAWEGATLTTWKAWMGRASKNSWATMKGVLS